MSEEHRYLGLAAVKREGKPTYFDPAHEAEMALLYSRGPYWTHKDWKRLGKLVDIKNGVTKKSKRKRKKK